MAIIPDPRVMREQHLFQMEFERGKVQAQAYTAAQQSALQQAMAMGVPSELLSHPSVYYDELRQRWQQELVRPPPRPDERLKDPRYGDAPPPSVGQKTWPSPRPDQRDHALDALAWANNSVNARAMKQTPSEPDLDRDGVLDYLTKRKNDWLSGVRLPA